MKMIDPELVAFGPSCMNAYGHTGDHQKLLTRTLVKDKIVETILMICTVCSHIRSAECTVEYLDQPGLLDGIAGKGEASLRRASTGDYCGDRQGISVCYLPEEHEGLHLCGGSSWE